MLKTILEYREIPEKDKILEVSNTFNLNEYVSILLIQRIGYNLNEIKNFLDPNIDNLHNPFMFENIKSCIDLFIEHIKNKNKILLYGDYDVDGITGTALLYNFIKDNYESSDNITYQVADRFSEGYGLAINAVEQAIKDGVSLIVTIDCGTKDYKSIELARDNNIDVIVLDHHEFGDEENKSNFIINPKNKEYDYPFKYLSGCAVVFKLIQAINIYKNLNTNIFKYLDIVSLSVCCDVVPLIDENRVLLIKGLEIINTNPCSGLKALCDFINLENISTKDIAFKIGPMLNAPGRLFNAKICVDLLISNNIDEIISIISEINNIYSLRKELCNNAMKEISFELDNSIDRIPIFINDNWSAGILGIIAARCVEKTSLPSLIMTSQNEDYIVGSARSIEGINILEIIESCSEYLYKFGGHEMASGFIVKKENVDIFCENIEKQIQNKINEINYRKKIIVDIKIQIKDLNEDFFNNLKKIAPFGEGNKKPIFESVVTLISSKFFYNNTIFNIKDESGKIFTGIFKNSNLKIEGLYKIIYTIEEYSPLKVEIIKTIEN